MNNNPPSWPEWAKDAIICRTEAKFSYKDRIRILFGCKVQLRTKTYIDCVTEHLLTESSVYVDYFFPQKEQTSVAYAAEKSNEE